MTQHDLSADVTARLAKFRAEIDGIDQQLIALFKKRIAIVQQVGDMKREESDLQSFIRSGREAEMLRTIYAEFQGSDFHPLAATAIWRQIIAASTHCEQPLNAAVLQQGPETTLYWLTREYFGSFTNIETYDTADQLFAFSRKHQGGIAVVPFPQADGVSLTSPWWQDWLKLSAPRPLVFGCLPFTTANNLPDALLLSHITPEATEDDISLFVIESDEELTTEALDEWCSAKDLKAQMLQRSNSSQLISVDGYYDSESEQIQQLRLDFPTAIKHMHYLGSYARPIAL